jgi:hypothetical protein
LALSEFRARKNGIAYGRVRAKQGKARGWAGLFFSLFSLTILVVILCQSLFVFSSFECVGYRIFLPDGLDMEMSALVFRFVQPSVNPISQNRDMGRPATHFEEAA